MDVIHTCLLQLLCLLFIQGSLAFKSYQTRIPNGDSVPHPCKKNLMWIGVGHLQMKGGGPRNVFGKDFAAANHKWSSELCMKDSDQDGRTNGEELGDPDCTWTVGSKPQNSTNISHPGICNPVDSPECRAIQNYECGGEYSCNATKSPDVKYIDLKFPLTKVPENETTYICHTFKAPSDKQYHAIAFEPLLNNTNVIHHITVYACTEDEIGKEDKPHLCVMSKCRTYITVWTVGLEGYCLHDEVGLLFGNNSYTHFSLEFHWNNPFHRTDYYDASGMRVFYTDKLRQYQEGTMFFGQTFLKLPPNTADVAVTGTCTSKCSREKFTNGVSVTSVLLHMHYLGYKGKAEQYRNGKLIRVLADDSPYFYESPVLHKFDPPIRLEAGDEIVTKCHFNTKDDARYRNKTIWFGAGTQDEMCFTIVNYYPKYEDVQSSFCFQFAKYEPCGETGMFGKCDFAEFGNLTAEMYKTYKTVCEPSGKLCSSECHDHVTPILKHSCMKDEIGDWYRNYMYEFQPHPFNDVVTACEKGITTSGQSKVMFNAFLMVVLLVAAIM